MLLMKFVLLIFWLTLNFECVHWNTKIDLNFTWLSEKFYNSQHTTDGVQMGKIAIFRWEQYKSNVDYRVYHFYRGFRIRANENNCNAQPRAASTLHISLQSYQKSSALKMFLLEYPHLAISILNTYEKTHSWKMVCSNNVGKGSTVDSASQG